MSCIPEEVIMSKIFLIRGKKVMLDADLADLYGVETKQLKRAVKRNITRFPHDFMFELTADELANWRCQYGTSNREKLGMRIKPFAFTEHGVLMLASVLNSEQAIRVNIQIVRIFAKIRELLSAHSEIIEKLNGLEQKFVDHDDKIALIFEYLKQLEQTKHDEISFKERIQIGFR